MSLKPIDTQPQEQQPLAQQPQEQQPQTQQKPKTKLQQAIELMRTGAKDGKPLTQLPYNEARSYIMEKLNVSRATAHQAYHAVMKKPKTQQIGTIRPSLKIEQEPEKKPEFVAEPQQPIEELPSTAEIKDVSQEPQIVQTDYMRDMLRGLHVLLLSKEGILGEKYGRKMDTVVQTSDQLHRYLMKRIGTAELERYDTTLLFLSYLSLLGGIITDIIKDRRAKK